MSKAISRRTERHMISFTPAEFAEVERAAYAAGQSVPEYTRSVALSSARAALRCPVTVPEEPVEFT